VKPLRIALPSLPAGLVVGLLISLVAAPSFAAPPSSDGASAQLFFERGREAADKGEATSAGNNFEESLRLEIAVGTLFNLAQCEEKLGRLASAWQHLREGIGRLEPSDPRVPPARKAADALAPRIPKLQILLASGAPSTLRVSRDGVALTGLSLSEPLPVNPGKHTVLVEDDGFEPNRFEVELAEGESKTLTVEPGKPLPDAPVKKPTTGVTLAAQESSPLRTAGWVGIALGGASLGVGLVTGGLSYERSRVVKDHCDASGVCDSDGLSALSSAKTYGGIATVTTLVGIGVLGAGVVLLLVTKPSVSHAVLHLTEFRF
jgi:hypothetical protein